jgi:cell division protease FtsH
MKFRITAFLVVIAVALVLMRLFTYWDHVSDDASASHVSTAAQRFTAPRYANTEASYDQVLSQLTQNTGPSRILSLTYKKDANGHVQEVEISYADGHDSSIQLPGEAGTAKLLDAAQKAGVQETVTSDSPNLWALIFSLLPLVVIVFLVLFVVSRLSKAANKQGQMTSVKTSKNTREKVMFADVAGAEEAKATLMESCEYLRDPKSLGELGGKAPSGILMVGPPGNGKTLLARAVAGEAGVPFFSMSGSQFVEMFVGVGAGRIRDLFAKARKAKPCVVFIDEIDAVGRQRGTGIGGGNDEREQTLNQLLVELDGPESNEGIILIAATNRPDVLDPALTRPGRYNQQILVDGADKHGRTEILKVHARNKKLAADVDLSLVAANTPGFSGAQLAEVLSEGAGVANRRIKAEKKALAAQGVSEASIKQQVPMEINQKDLDEACDRVQMGPPREGRARRMLRAEKENTAVHEVGHAVVSQLMHDAGKGGDPVTKITIVPRALALGYTIAMPEDDRYGLDVENMLARITMAMGGRAAQEVILNKVDTGASNDFEKAWSLASSMVTKYGMSNLGPISVGEAGANPFLGRQMAVGHQVGAQLADQIDNECRRIVGDCLAAAKKIIEENRQAVDKVVEVLMEQETILGPEFCALLRQP